MPVINPPLPADGDDAVVSPYNAAINAILGVINGNVDADNIAAGAIGLSELSTTIQGFLVPTASIIAFGGSMAPTGWLMCDGSSVLRTTYSSLFAALGTAYGSADGTHFNLPDFRGRTPVGADAMGGTAANRIQRTSTITTTSGSPTATVGSATGLSVGMFVFSTNVTAGTTITAISGTTLTLSANASGSGTTIAATFSILSGAAATLGSAGGADVHQLIVAQLAAHTHTTTLPANAVAGGNANFYAGNNTNTGSPITSSTGGDQAHPNMQPSLVVNYVIKT